MSEKYCSIVKDLSSWDSNGIKKVDDGVNKGTILICKAPHIGTEAWFHEIYLPSLNEDEIKHIATSLKVDLPDDYIEFFKEFNGINIFSDELSIWGLRKSYKRTGDEVYQPYDVITHNQELRAKKPGSVLVVGSYSYDNSLIAYNLADSKTKVFRYNSSKFKVLNTWQSLTELLESEVKRLSRLFDEKGVKINKNASTVPV